MVQLTILIVRVPSIYNTILDRPDLNTLKVAISTYHLLVHFSTNKGVGEMYGYQTMAWQYFMIFAKINQPMETVLVDILDALDEVGRIWDDSEKLKAIYLGDDSKKMVQIGVNLKPSLSERMIKFL